eukprot:354206-Chlamydomonas_euryale.AAC.9
MSQSAALALEGGCGNSGVGGTAAKPLVLKGQLHQPWRWRDGCPTAGIEDTAAQTLALAGRNARPGIGGTAAETHPCTAADRSVPPCQGKQQAGPPANSAQQSRHKYTTSRTACKQHKAKYA